MNDDQRQKVMSEFILNDPELRQDFKALEILVQCIGHLSRYYDPETKENLEIFMHGINKAIAKRASNKYSVSQSINFN